MKKILGVLIVLNFLSCSKEKGSADSELARSEFKKNCIEAAKQLVSSQGVQIVEADIEGFCDCSGDKVLKEFSEEELVKLGVQDAEMMSKAQELAKPCLQEFMDKLNKQILE